MNDSIPFDGRILSPVQQAVKDHFRDGGSWVAILVVLGILAAVICAITIVNHYQQRKHILKPLASDPQKLFEGLTHGLALPPSQATLLTEIVRDLKLAHPTVLLMSCSFYDASMSRWVRQARLSSEKLSTTQQSLMNLRNRLFPNA